MEYSPVLQFIDMYPEIVSLSFVLCLFASFIGGLLVIAANDLLDGIAEFISNLIFRIPFLRKWKAKRSKKQAKEIFDNVFDFLSEYYTVSVCSNGEIILVKKDEVSDNV